MEWTLVVPLKPLSAAKSRLAEAVGPVRPGLALAFAQDTVAAALACEAVRDVTVVTDDPLAGSVLAALGARVEADSPAAGLNAALRHGADAVLRRHPAAAVAALNADLPALRPLELAAVLRAAARSPGRSFLADAAGIGTTLLAATAGTALEPAFGGPSRARHRASGAHEIALPDVDSVRRDVDTGEDLAAALLLGVGPHTRALLRPALRAVPRDGAAGPGPAGCPAAGAPAPGGGAR
ncbi:MULTISPECIES: 2-phospho-L-lactate guanylyltransferase [unclassified Streptomyces]|uniref:2-phospho-L-lactate guanylyltransferase n=1 Tax=unclassified Streptomyces TaxID=2593676 RepID=UPI00036ED7C9|nr:2-phospho-L-lactate guanylyltransferase [Streptomyces sp. BoleA5]MYX36309.1 2-phospho-L-lactate guanylyltransferase [Streptomyces sp. SID8377]